MEALADQGLYVLRMGSIVEKPVNSAHPRVIDYANSEFRSEFGDIFLGANCKFCVSDGLGFFAVPAAFRRPNAYVNYAPFHMFYSSRKCDLGITKIFKDPVSGEVIPLRHLIGRDVARLTRSELIEEAGLKLAANSPEEITQLMTEMNDRIDGTWVSHQDSEKMQEDFWKMFARVIGFEGLRIHGEFRSRFGETFLLNHHDWFAE
jgi:putative glycosyltransferase (TIGR04372 family)